MGLTFDEVSHVYKADGIVVPSVTTIMKPLSDASYFMVSDDVLNKAAEKGTNVHNAIENWLKFGIVDVDPDYKGYFDAFLDWFNKEQPKIIDSERRLYHKIMMYAGTADLIAEIGGKLVLIDYKTTFKILDKNCSVQLEAYSQALGTENVNVDEKRILHLKSDGSWSEHIHKSKDMKAWRVFSSLKTIYDFAKE